MIDRDSVEDQLRRKMNTLMEWLDSDAAQGDPRRKFVSAEYRLVSRFIYELMREDNRKFLSDETLRDVMISYNRYVMYVGQHGYDDSGRMNKLWHGSLYSEQAQR